ncbi:meprin A subunit alpha isoform X5 [Hydra vulgaris]|uniref:Metalloendopeptidase n=1 Tax=Hydra vulgaris TaxID=6087 RepID=A0ABM4BTQ3_HYDVU
MKFPFCNFYKFVYYMILLTCVNGQIKNKNLQQNSRENIQDAENIMVDKKQLEIATIIDEPFESAKTIEEINIAYGRFSDIKFPPDNRRSFSKFVTLWKDSNGKPRVPYVINIGPDNTTTNYTTIIKQSVRAMNEYMSPCGHDVWVEKEDSDKSGYIEFITTLNNGCWSAYVGKQGIMKQQIGIGYGCNTKGTILHEMLHAMGFLHEQQRCDRDSYIEIVKTNINNFVGGAINAMAQFECYYSIQQTHYSTPYDIFSIMHYDLWALSKRPKRTANTKTMRLKPEFMNLTIDIEELIGKTGRLSDTDKQEVNTLYGCIAPTCIVSCNGTNTCAELPPTPNDKMRAQDQPSMIDLVINPTDKVVQLSVKELCLNEVIGTMSSLEKAYSVSFKLKPYSYSRGWENVLHITKGQNYGECGDRNPAVFLHKDGSGRLVFFSAINGNINSEFETKNPLPLNVWSSIKIEQTLKNRAYVYAIYVNGSIQCEIENKDPRQFKDIKVYISDPWYTAHDGDIKELFVINGDSKKISDATQPQDKFEDASEQKLQENNLFATMSFLSTTFTVSFQIKPTSYSIGKHSVFHFMQDKFLTQIANKKISAWFHEDGSGRLVIVAGFLDNDKKLTEFTTKDSLPLNQWSSIKLTRTKALSKYRTNFNIYLNDKRVFNVEKEAETFEFVRVYFGDPWNSVQNGYIKDLKIYNN